MMKIYGTDNVRGGSFRASKELKVNTKLFLTNLINGNNNSCNHYYTSGIFCNAID